MQEPQKEVEISGKSLRTDHFQLLTEKRQLNQERLYGQITYQHTMHGCLTIDVASHESKTHVHGSSRTQRSSSGAKRPRHPYWCVLAQVSNLDPLILDD